MKCIDKETPVIFTGNAEYFEDYWQFSGTSILDSHRCYHSPRIGFLFQSSWPRCKSRKEGQRGRVRGVLRLFLLKNYSIIKFLNRLEITRSDGCFGYDFFILRSEVKDLPELGVWYFYIVFLKYLGGFKLNRYHLFLWVTKCESRCSGRT